MESSHGRAWREWKALHDHWGLFYVLEGIILPSVTAAAVILVGNAGWSNAGQIWTGVVTFAAASLAWAIGVYVILLVIAPRRQLAELRLHLTAPPHNRDEVIRAIGQVAAAARNVMTASMLRRISSEPESTVLVRRERTRLEEFARARDRLEVEAAVAGRQWADRLGVEIAQIQETVLVYVNSAFDDSEPAPSNAAIRRIDSAMFRLQQMTEGER